MISNIKYTMCSDREAEVSDFVQAAGHDHRFFGRAIAEALNLKRAEAQTLSEKLSSRPRMLRGTTESADGIALGMPESMSCPLRSVSVRIG